MNKHFLDSVTGFLGLGVQYNLTYSENLEAAAFYLPDYSGDKLVCHNIVIWKGEDFRDEYQLTAHEFIHAWQEENGFAEKEYHHGSEFKYLAKYLRIYLRNNGYPDLGHLYIRTVDNT